MLPLFNLKFLQTLFVRTIFACLLSAASQSVLAVQWTKLHENAQSKLSIDKQSILEKDQLKKAWLKIEYKTPQKNLQNQEKTFNLAKVLWYFDCPSQKSATSQVAQYLNDEMVFSAGIDAKKAEFIEPVPETDVDIAMRYVCEVGKVAKPAADPKATSAKTADSKNPDLNAADKAENKEANAESAAKDGDKAAEKNVDDKKSEGKPSKTKLDAKSTSAGKLATTDAKKVPWNYEGDSGPEHWGKLHPEFSGCDSGRNQSPINIDEPIKASLKKIRSIQKFPAKSIENTGYDIKLHFKEGNMMVLDNAPYQLKYIAFHSPSEHSLHGKNFPLEAQFFHTDAKGNVTIVAALFKEGKPNAALDKLFEKLAPTVSVPVEINARLIASEFMPENQDYFRYGGSLTAPPCTEGVRWVMMKNALNVSKEQVEKINKALKHANNRPLQAVNGRIVLE